MAYLGTCHTISNCNFQSVKKKQGCIHNGIAQMSEQDNVVKKCYNCNALSNPNSSSSGGASGISRSTTSGLVLRPLTVEAAFSFGRGKPPPDLDSQNLEGSPQDWLRWACAFRCLESRIHLHLQMETAELCWCQTVLFRA